MQARSALADFQTVFISAKADLGDFMKMVSVEPA
jgi:hypothetical protein